MMDTASGIAAAGRALANGDADGALALLVGIEDPSALHLRALAQRRAGRLDEARRCFEAALASAPHDPQLANNFANLLRQLGARQQALALYDRALAAQPGYRDAAFNKSLLLTEMGDHAAALELLERLSRAQPADARAHSARGAVLRSLGRHQAAASAYEAALQAQPDLVTALKGRAQIALECGESDAAPRYRRAIEADPADLGAVHGYAEALEAAGDPDVAAMLETILKSRPDWIAGHTLLARIRAEQGDPDFARHMHAGARHDPALAMALASVLASAGQWQEALAALPQVGGEDLSALRAHYLSEAGQPEAALALLGADASASPAIAAAAARAHLRLNDPAAAAGILRDALAATPEAIGLWGLLEIAWRLTGDTRQHWLSGQQGLVAVRDIGLDTAQMTELAALLRELHRTRAHPIGQSLRGGTQTRGALFLRHEPILARLHEALSASLAQYLAALPPADDGHPLLKFRHAPLTIGGSWSVRLVDAGFHVNHIHPEGLISSACYIALPARAAQGGERAGWLELGRPPAELGLQLEPLAVVEPQVGRLVLFPSYLFHGTRPFTRGERLTVAFDVVAA